MPIKLDFEDPFESPAEQNFSAPIDFKDPFASSTKKGGAGDVYSRLLNPVPAEDTGVKARDALNKAGQSRGFFNDVLSGASRGGVSLLESAGHVMKYADSPGGSDFIRNLGETFTKKAESLRETHPFLQPSREEKESYLRRSVTGTLESAPLSLGPSLGGAAAGAAIGSVIPGIGTIIGGLAGGALSTLGAFYASSYNKTYEDAIKEGKSEEEAKSLGRKIGLIEGGVEFLTTPVELMTAGFGKVVTQPLKNTIKQMLKTPVRQLLKNFVQTAAIETGTEGLQNYWEASVLQNAGMDTPPPMEALVESIGPALGMTVLFTMGAHGLNRHRLKGLQENLSNPEADPKERTRAALEIGQLIQNNFKDKELTDHWLGSAVEAIQTNSPIAIDEDVQQWATRKLATEAGEATGGEEAAKKAAVGVSGEPEGTTGEEVQVPIFPPKTEVGESRPIPGPSDILVEWTKKKPSRILDQEKYSPEMVAEKFGISTDLAKTALDEAKGKLIADIERRITNLESHPDVKNRGKLAQGGKTSKPLNNYTKLLNQYSQLTGAIYDRQDTEGVHGEVGGGQEPGGAVSGAEGPGEGGSQISPSGILEKQEGKKEGQDLIKEGGVQAPTAEEIDQAAHEAATSPLNDLPEPTEAQKQAGNYKKGAINLHGLDISIENPKGAERSGADRSGKEWSVTMQSHYGYIRRTEGKDGDHVDTFIGEKPESDRVFVVNQVNPESGKFDEHKVMMGYDSEEAARKAYLANYEKGWKGLGSIIPVKMDRFKEWLKDGDLTKPFEGEKEAAPVQPENLPPHKITTEKGGIYKGWRLAAVTEGPHKGVVAFGRDDADAEKELRRLIKGREKKEVPPAEAPKEKRLTVNVVKGKEGVSRLTYLQNGHLVGNARLLGSTIGDIEVNKKFRRQGFGSEMIGDLVERGGRSATTVNEASRGLFAKAGFVEDSPGHFVLKESGAVAEAEKETVEISEQDKGKKEKKPKVVGGAEEKKPPKEPAKKERRVDLGRRKKIEEMSPEEIKKELLTHPLTGLPNKRAYEEAESRAIQVSIDVDSLKWVNDHFSHDVGDELLKEVGKALADQVDESLTGFEAYHVSGDEFIVQGTFDQEVTGRLARASEALKAVTLKYTAPDGTVQEMKGIGFSYGKGSDLEIAEIGLQKNKKEREALGERAGRGERPPGVVEVAPEGGKAGGQAGEAAKVEAPSPAEEGQGETKHLVPETDFGKKLLEVWDKAERGEIKPLRVDEAIADASAEDIEAAYGNKGLIGPLRTLINQERANRKIAESKPLKPETIAPKEELKPTEKEPAREAAIGVVSGGIVDRIEAAGLEFVWGGSADEAIGPVSGQYADRLKEAGIGVRRVPKPEEQKSVEIGKYTVKPSHTWKWIKPNGDVRTFSYQHDAEYAQRQAGGEGEVAPTGNWSTGEMFDGAWHGQQFKTKEEAIKEATRLDELNKKNAPSQTKEPEPEFEIVPLGAAKPKEQTESKSYYFTNDKGKNEIHFDKAEFNALPPGIQKDIKRFFLWAPSRKAWVSKGKAGRGYLPEIIRKAGLTQRIEEAGAAVSPTIPLTSEIDELKIKTGSVLEEQEGGVEDVVRPGTGEGQVGDDRTGLKGPGATDLSVPEKREEVAGVSEGPRREHDAELSGNVRGSLAADHEEPEGRVEKGAGTAHDPKRGLAPDHGNLAGLQRPDANDLRITPGALDRVGSWRETAGRNLDIIQLVKKLETENRLATPEEQILLVKYVGWGAGEIRNKLFSGYRAGEGELNPDDYNIDKAWKPLVERAAALLTKEEVKTAARSSQYAHYTNEQVIRSIWNGLKRMGFPGGRIFEPGMGTGNFVGLMPDDIYSKSSYTGIEFDHLTAGVAKQLYQKQNIILGDFTKQTFPNNFFDLSIGNPPFSRTKILADPEYKKYGFAMHNYFFAKSIDKTKPGGLLVFVTSHYTMDARESKIRGYLADRADLVGAIRLPQTAFKESAGTEVVTDIIFLRKRAKGEEAGGHPWANIGEVKIEGGETKLVNEYFGNNPDMVLGTHSGKGTMYGKNEYTVLPKEGNIEAHFAAAIEKLPENVAGITNRPAEEQKQVVIERDWDPKNKKEGGLYLSDKGDLMRVSFGSGVPLASEVKIIPQQTAWLKDAIPLRDFYKKARYDQFMDQDWEMSLADLNKAYDKFVKKHGNIVEFTTTERTETDEEGNKTVVEYRRYKNEKIALLDVEGPLILSLENVSEDGEITKSVFFTERTIKKPERGEIKSLGDAMAISLDDKGKLDLDHIAELLGRPRETMAEEMGDLVYENPSGTWEQSDEYLSGDVVAKLEEAEAAAKTDPRYQRNVAALGAVQPKPLSPKNITVKLGAPWIDPQHIMDFAGDVLNLNASIGYHAEANRWSVRLSEETGRSWSRRKKAVGKQSQRGVSDWGTPDRGANEILESVLNRTRIIIKRTENLPGGGTRTYTDEAATTSANEKAREMDERFSQWIWEEADRADYFLNTYNRRYNNLAKRTFNGDHLTLPGTSLRYALHAHQKTAIWRVIQTGNTYLAHAVGSGKTIESIAAGMEMKRLGLIQKPMYVVPNHMLKQFAGEFMDLYPMANIMVADDENFHTTNRRRFMAQASVNKPDAIIITHSSYGLLSMKPENIQTTKDIILNDLRQALEDLRDEGGARHLIRQIEQRIEQAEQRFDSIASSKKGDHVVDFEDMGVDFLFVDEAHMFRKLDFATNQQVKGIDPNGSRMALDLYLKAKYLESKTPGRSHVFMSGTPITNTMGELYTIMKFFDEAAMEKDAIKHFDAWSSMFGETRPDYEPNAAGRYELVTRFAKFNNLPELRKRVGMFMDVLTTRQLKEHVKGIPKIEGGEPKYILAMPSDELKAYQQTLQARLESSRKWKPSPGQKGNPDPVINIITDGRLAAIDMRFVNPRLKTDPGSKLNMIIEEIVKDYKALKGNTYLDKDGNQEPIKGGTQIVFYNHGFGKAVTGRRGFDAKGWVNDQLRKGGVPIKEVAWIDDYDTATKKEALYKEMRLGQKKILIGSAKRMGTGLNVQKRLAALQYLDAPWYPADVSQPHGRIVRQGNQNKEVSLKWYATKATYDSTMWQMVSRKEGFIEQFFDGDDNLRSMEDISEINQYEMARALSSGDERVIKLVGLQSEQAKLSRLKEAHAQEQHQLRTEKSRLEWSTKELESRIKELKKAYEKVGGYVSDFEAQVGNQKGITKRTDLGEAVIKGYNKAMAELGGEVEEKEYGKINGLSLVAVKKYAMALNVLRVTPKVEYTIDPGLMYPEATDPQGLGRRIINQINKVSDELDNANSELKDQKEKLDQVVKRIGTPFSKERELVEKIAEIAQLQHELTQEGEVDEGKIAEAQQAIAKMEEGGPRFSRQGESKGVGLSIAQVQKVISPITGNINQKVEVVNTVTELPKNIRSSLTKVGIPEVSGRVVGVFDPASGKIYLVAENLVAADHVQRILAHELIGHLGVRGVLGDRFRPVMNRIFLAYGQTKMQALADDYNLDLTKSEDKQIAAEEMVARMAETGEKPGILKEIYAAIRATLRRMGFDLEWTDADLQRLIQQAREYVEGGGGITFSTDQGQTRFMAAQEEIKAVDEEGNPRYAGPEAPEISDQESARFSLFSRKDLDQEKVRKELDQYDETFDQDKTQVIRDMLKNWGKGKKEGRPDTSMLGRFFGSPEFTFERVPALKKVLTHSLERADLKVEKFNQIISDAAGRDLHVGMRDLQKDRPEEYRRLKGLIKRADQNKAAFNPDRLRSKGFSDQAIDAWRDYRAVMDNGLNLLIADMREMERRAAEAGLPPPQVVMLDDKGQPQEVSIKTAIAQMGEMRGWYAPRIRNSGRFQLVARPTQEMKDQGLHPIIEFKDFGVEWRAAQLRNMGYRVEIFKSKGMPEDLFAVYGKVMGTEQMINEALQRSLKEVGNKRNFHFSDMKIDAMWGTSTDDKPDLILDTKKVPQKQLAKVMPIIKALGGRWYGAKGEPKYWHFVGADKRLEGRLRRALSRYDNRLLLVEEEFSRALAVNVANIEKGRGFRSSMIQRGPAVGVDVWEGYEADPSRAMTLYASGIAGGMAKKETSLKMIRAFNGMEKTWAQFKAENEDAEYEDYMKLVEASRVSPTEQKNAYHDGLNYIQEVLRNPEFADRVVGVAKGLANFKYLGFRVAAPLVNLTALITSVPAAMNGYADIPLHDSFKWLAKGADLFMQYRHPEKWSSLPADIQEAFKTIQKKGWAESQYNREAMAVLKGKVGRGWNRAMDASMLMFGTTEKLNRVSTIMGSFLALRGQGKGIEEALETAKKVSDRAHGVYGPATLPAVAWGKGPAGWVVKSLYMFKKFQHTYLQTMYELGWKQKNWKAATYMMVAPTLLAGAGALPLPWVWEFIMKAIKGLFGVDDPEEKFYSFMEDSLGDYIGGIPRQGIAGFGGHGFDLRGSLGMGKIDVPTHVVELLGAPGSVLSDLYEGGRNILKGNVWKGAEKVFPRAAGTVMQAAREAQEGVTTRTNAPVFFGREQMKADFSDAFLRSLSFNPARIQRMKDIKWSEKQVTADYREARNDVYAQFKKFYLLPVEDRDKDKLLDLVAEVRSYNDRVRANGLAGIEPFITSQSIKTNLKRNLQPARKELLREMRR